MVLRCRLSRLRYSTVFATFVHLWQALLRYLFCCFPFHLVFYTGFGECSVFSGSEEIYDSAGGLQLQLGYSMGDRERVFNSGRKR